MMFYDMAVTVSTEGYYAHLLPDYGPEEDPASVNPRIFAAFLNISSQQEEDLKCIVYECRKGLFHVAAAVNMEGLKCKSGEGAVLRWIARNLELEEKHLKLKESREITAPAFRRLLLRAVHDKLCTEGMAKQVLRQTATTERSLQEMMFEPQEKHEEKPEVAFGTELSAEAQLDNLVGLASVKDLMGDLAAEARIRTLRREAGMPDSGCSMHMVFTGNPGTAKTTVARLTAQMLHENNLLPTENLVECGRSQLVGEYVGWTAVQVQKRFKEARGGVLLIDEAYSLATDSGEYGQEAIDTIVQEMENRRDDTVVIFTGYPGPMENFLEKNDGLRSRIGFHLEFADYTEEELLEILRRMAKERGFTLTAGAKKNARAILAEARSTESFGNGRFARKLLEQAQLCQARRLAPRAKAGQTLTPTQLSRLSAKDLQEAGRKVLEGLKHEETSSIGFKVKPMAREC